MVVPRNKSTLWHICAQAARRHTNLHRHIPHRAKAHTRFPSVSTEASKLGAPRQLKSVEPLNAGEPLVPGGSPQAILGTLIVYGAPKSFDSPPRFIS